MSKPLTYDDLKSEFRIASSGDAWGDVLHWWFAVAEEIHFNRPRLLVPRDWQFQPSPMGMSSDPDDYATGAVALATDDALQRFGALLNRVAGALKRAGKGY